MKNKMIYMFFTLQFLFILTNYQNNSHTLFSLDLSDVLKVIIILFNSLYIFFYSKNNINKKIVYLSILFLTFFAFIFDNYSVGDLLTNYYYISTFTFLLFSYYEFQIDRFKTSLLSILLLVILDIALLINNQCSITIELLIMVLLGLLFSFYNKYKKIFIPVYLLTIIVSIICNMNFVLYNSLIFSIISLLCFRNKRDLIYGSSMILLSIISLVINNLLSFSKLFHTFELFSININFTSFVIVIPFILYICYVITRCILDKKRNNRIIINLYTSIIITSLMLISINNIYNELFIIFYSLLIITLIDYLNNNSKELKDEITFFVLHLGYGGIESSTINSANELSKIYNINIVSFYKLKRNIENTIDKKVKVKYLYNGEPNKEELIDSIKNRKIIDIIKNGFKAVNILFLKQYYVSKEMYECDSKFVVSTRNEFTILLSEYGNNNAIKIAQEHMHHRDNKKYINNIKYEFNNINYLFALTESLKKDYEAFLKDNKETKVVIIPNIIYLPKKKASLKNKNLITISRLNSIKKIEDMIEIFSKINNKKSKLYIVGDGEELIKLKKLTNDYSLDERVIFTGYKTKEEMEEYILNSSIFLLTSWSEGLPMVLLESMSYGVPCIAFETKSGVKDIIDDNINGFIIKNRNKAKYVEKIDELLNNKELLNEFSKNSLEKSKKYTAKEIIKKWQGVIENEKEK